MNKEITEKLSKFYSVMIPEYVVDAGKTFITLRVGDWSGDLQKVKITLKDVIHYYATQARNFTSGCRTIAGYTGDWRPIDNIAKECLEWFKLVNVEGLRKEGKKWGMEARF